MIHSRDEHNKYTLNKTQYKVLKRVTQKEKDAQVFAAEKLWSRTSNKPMATLSETVNQE